jgi:hypothetical protein
VLGKHRREIAAECHVGADEDAQACGESQTNGFVVGVSNADREAAPLHLGFEIEHAKHLRAVRGYSIFLLYNSNVAKAQGFDQGLNDRVMWHRFVG